MKNMRGLCLLLALGFVTLNPAFAGTPPGPARAYFISPQDGQRVRSPITVRFGLQGMGVAPAGTTITGTGHHHLLLDTPLPPLDAPIPKDDHHRHFGGGQTEAVLTLKPGQHTLQLLLGDGGHMPHKPAVASRRITIFVVPDPAFPRH